MGILQNRLLQIKGKMNVCMAKMNMEHVDKKNVDPETERLKFRALDQEYAKVEKALTAYEDLVLDLTSL